MKNNVIGIIIANVVLFLFSCKKDKLLVCETTKDEAAYAQCMSYPVNTTPAISYHYPIFNKLITDEIIVYKLENGEFKLLRYNISTGQKSYIAPNLVYVSSPTLAMNSFGQLLVSAGDDFDDVKPAILSGLDAHSIQNSAYFSNMGWISFGNKKDEIVFNYRALSSISYMYYMGRFDYQTTKIDTLFELDFTSQFAISPQGDIAYFDYPESGMDLTIRSLKDKKGKYHYTFDYSCANDLNTNASNKRNIVFAPNGYDLFFTSEEKGIYKLNIQTGNLELFYTLCEKRVCSSIDISPDGKFLITKLAHDLVLINIATKEEQIISIPN